MAFTDIVGSYLQNRMDQATQPFTDPNGYMQNRLDNAFPGTETEEEKRKRLEREAAARGNTEVMSTQVKTYADGSQEEVVKKQLPPQQPVAPTAPVAEAQPAPVVQAPQQPVAPQAPVVQAPQQLPVQQAPAQPVAPQAPDTFNRMIQAESGGQQFNPQGGVLTSPKGALGQAQIMPATAAQPGYGVKPATPEEIATPEGNRAFGERYYQGLLKHFNGDEQKAIAAYNAGPGRVQQNMQANNGQLNVAQLPQETQGYLNKVQGPVAPGAAQPQPMIAGTPSSDVGLTPTEQAVRQQQLQQPWSKDLIAAENNTDMLYTIAGDTTGKYPAEVKQIARDRAVQASKAEQEQQRAEKLAIDAAKGDPKASNELMRRLKDKSEEGSYIKAYMYSRLGLNDLARSEQEKLSGPKFNQVTLGNQPYFVESKNGAIVAGYDKNGAKVDETTLTKLNTQSLLPGKIDLVGGTYVSDTLKDRAGNALVGRVVTNKNTGESFVQTDEGLKPMAGFRPQASTGSLSDMRARTIQDLNLKLQGKTAEEKLAILRPYNQQLVGQGYQPIGADEVGLSAPQIGGAPAVAQPGQPAPGQAAPVAGQRPTATELSAGKTQAEETGRQTGKATGEVAAKDIKNQAFADSSYSLIKPISDAIKESTGSALGTGVDTVAGAISKSTKGAQAIAKLDVLGYSLVSNVPRFEGPQGQRDVELYERAAGDLANSKKPIETRLAALDAVITLLKKYDKAGNNDWSFSNENKQPAAGGGIKIISREKI